MKRLSSLLLIVSFFAATSSASQPFTGEVVSVKDGDTIEVMRSGRAVTVRLHGIDTPEMGQDFGYRAKQQVSNYVFGEAVRVDITDVDRYGRLVGQRSRRQSVADRDCSDFNTQAAAQRFFKRHQPGDPHRLDGDGDGIVCESLQKD